MAYYFVMTIIYFIYLLLQVESQKDRPYATVGCYNVSKQPYQLQVDFDEVVKCQVLCTNNNKEAFALQRVGSDSRYVWCSCLDDLSALGQNSTYGCWFSCLGGEEVCGGPDHFTVFSDADECAFRPPKCARQSSCRNLVGAYSCEGCPGGYVQDQDDSSKCTDICHTPFHICGKDKCVNIVNSYNCCREGYLAVNNNCTDVDECVTDNGGCDQDCVNLPGSHACECRAGYIADRDGVCRDVDECMSDNGGCPEMCTNTIGAYRCEKEPPKEESSKSGAAGRQLNDVTASVLLLVSAAIFVNLKY